MTDDTQRRRLIRELVTTKRLAHFEDRANAALRKEEAARRRVDLARQAGANAAGTVLGGAMLALLAEAVGAIDALSTRTIVVGWLLVVAAISLVTAYSVSRIGRDAFDSEAAEREAEREADALIAAGMVEHGPFD